MSNASILPATPHRTIENNDTPYAPAELGGDVEFVVFASDPPLLQEATVLLKSRHAIVLGDLGFKQDDSVFASLPVIAQVLNRSFKLQGKLAAPIPYPAMVKVCVHVRTCAYIDCASIMKCMNLSSLCFCWSSLCFCWS